jgi:TRAP-type mannitol/chloroaromatic compound transport system permease large subunit
MALLMVMLVMFLLGFILDFIEITFVVVPCGWASAAIDGI